VAKKKGRREGWPYQKGADELEGGGGGLKGGRGEKRKSSIFSLFYLVTTKDKRTDCEGITKDGG